MIQNISTKLYYVTWECDHPELPTPFLEISVGLDRLDILTVVTVITAVWGNDTVKSKECVLVFQTILLRPPSGKMNNPIIRVCEKPYSSTMMTAAVTSEMTVHLNQTTQPHIPEDKDLKRSGYFPYSQNLLNVY